MIKKVLISLVLIAACGVNLQLRAQETIRVSKSRSNIQNNRVCVVKLNSIENGCEIIFNHEVKAPLDVATGQSRGKRQVKPIQFIVSSIDNSVTRIIKPADAQTGSSGQKTAGHIKDISVKGGLNPGGSEFDKIKVEDGRLTLPVQLADGEYDMDISWKWGTTNPGGSKRYRTTFILTMADGACMAINTKGRSAKL